MTVLSLCDYTGAWSKPYREAGYDVVQVDTKHGQDVRLFAALPFPVRGVLAAPPCTEFARSGARWWPEKGEQALLDGLAVVDACLRIVTVHRPQWWVLENPVGRLRTYLGAPRMSFDPCDYGDPYTKRTLLWGDFHEPLMARVPVAAGPNPIHYAAPGPQRSAVRSVTPSGFAQAFFESNP
jgi:hypothetical protein